MNQAERRLLVERWIEGNDKKYLNKKPPIVLYKAGLIIYEAALNDPELAWELILQILATCHSDEIYQSLAAGPVEDLLAFHGKEFIDRVERQAQADKIFKLALGALWSNRIDPDVWRRIEKVR